MNERVFFCQAWACDLLSLSKPKLFYKTKFPECDRMCNNWTSKPIFDKSYSVKCVAPDAVDETLCAKISDSNKKKAQ